MNNTKVSFSLKPADKAKKNKSLIVFRWKKKKKNLPSSWKISHPASQKFYRVENAAGWEFCQVGNFGQVQNLRLINNLKIKYSVRTKIKKLRLVSMPLTQILPKQKKNKSWLFCVEKKKKNEFSTGLKNLPFDWSENQKWALFLKET